MSEPAGFLCKPVKSGEVHKTGYLRKLGGVKDGKSGNWKKRYVVLKDDLYYYAEEEAYIRGNDPKGIVRLDIFFASVLDGENPDHQFTIHALPKSLTCRAETHEDMLQWVETINLFGRAA